MWLFCGVHHISMAGVGESRRKLGSLDHLRIDELAAHNRCKLRRQSKGEAKTKEWPQSTSQRSTPLHSTVTACVCVRSVYRIDWWLWRHRLNDHRPAQATKATIVFTRERYSPLPSYSRCFCTKGTTWAILKWDCVLYPWPGLSSSENEFE